MSRGHSADTLGGEDGPGMFYMPFVVMEDLLDKLKLLNYEIEFVSELKMRPLNRCYLRGGYMCIIYIIILLVIILIFNCMDFFDKNMQL